MIWTLLLGTMKFILLGMAVLYSFHVVLTLKNEGHDYHFKFDPHDPARSAEHFLVWLGVRTLAAILAVLNAGLNILEDTSADVGEWVIHRRNS